MHARREVLAQVRPDNFSTDLRTIHQLAARVFGRDAINRAADDELRRWWLSIVGGALAVLLLEEGFAVTTGPGEPFRFTQGDATVEPFTELAALFGGELSRDAWNRRWSDLGLASCDLGEIAKVAIGYQTPEIASPAP